MNNEFASFEKMPVSAYDQPADEINAEQIEKTVVIGEQYDDTPRKTYQERSVKVENTMGGIIVQGDGYTTVPQLQATSAEPRTPETPIGHQEVYPSDALLNELLSYTSDAASSGEIFQENTDIFDDTKEGEVVYETSNTYSAPEEAMLATASVYDPSFRQELLNRESKISGLSIEEKGQLIKDLFPEGWYGSSNEPETPHYTINPNALNSVETGETIEKAKHSNGFKQAIRTAFVIVGIGATLAACSSHNGSSVQTPNTSPTKINEGEKPAYEYVISKDAYGNEGMWGSDNKEGPDNFASAEDVAEINDNDPNKMIKYTASNQLETVADYVTALPDKIKPKGFDDLTAHDAEQKLEGMTDEEYEDVVKELFKIFDSANYSTKKIKGLHDNAYMKLKDPSKGVTLENMELVQGVTNENIEVTVLSWEGVSEQLMIKAIPQYDENGNIVGYKGCMQAIEKKGSSGRLDGLKVVLSSEEKVTEKPTKPTETTTNQTSETPTKPTTTETTTKLQPKDGEKEKEHAGNRVNQQKQEGKKTEEKDDQKVVKEAGKQIKEGGISGSQDEIGLQQTVDDSENVEKSDQESRDNANKSAADRANMFENGDY